HRLDVGLALGLHGLGFLLAGVLGIALHVVALLLGDLVAGLDLLLGDLAGVRVAGLVLLLQLGLGHVLLALGLLLAHVFGVVLERVALGLGRLVVGLDLVLGGLVFLARHGVRGLRAGEADGGDGHHEQVLSRGHGRRPPCAQYFSNHRAAGVRPSALSHSLTCFSASSRLMPWRSWILPRSWSRLPATTSKSSSVSLPHCSLILPLSCFQLPSMVSLFMPNSFA